MSLAKLAQQISDPDYFVIGDPSTGHKPAEINNADEVLYVDDDEDDNEDNDGKKAEPVGNGQVIMQVGDEEPMRLNFVLPNVPGADNQDEIEDPAEIVVEEEPESISVEEPDVWDWQKRGGISKFPTWLHHMFQNSPPHTGHDTVGLERIIAYLGALDREISKAVRSDLKSELDMSQIETARNEIQKGCDRCTDRLEKIISNKRPKKKKAQADGELVKEGQKISGIKGIMVTVPLLISRIARVCINGMVSGGHDIEDLFKRQAELYKLTMREKAELLQLLEDCGYTMRRDRGIHPDEDIDIRRSDNFDWAANYHA
jgi:hypothetical protein